MRTLLLTLAAILTLGACGADERRPVRQDPELDELFVQLGQAPDEQAAAGIEREIWLRWSDSGSPTVDTLLERARNAELEGDLETAEGLLDRASELEPEFAEPWNRRANLAYAAEDYRGAVTAIQETLRREPRHFAALAALGRIYEERGAYPAALEAYRNALAIHPYYDVALEGVRRLEPRVDGREA